MSEVKITSVFSSSPESRSASMMSSTPSSTASSASSRCWYFWRMSAIRAEPKRRSRLMRRGLSDTSRSPNPGGRGSHS